MCKLFNSFFYELLTHGGEEYKYERVKAWTKNVCTVKRWSYLKENIFDMEKLIFPLHLGNHWTLAVADTKAGNVQYLDSLGGTNLNCIEVSDKSNSRLIYTGTHQISEGRR